MRILIACSSILLLIGCAAEKQEPEVKPVVQVKVVKAEVADVPLTVVAPATIYPLQQASIAAKITAPIETLLVTKGDTVRSGQVIARLANRDLVAQRTEALDKARADAASTEAAQAQAQKNLERRQTLYNQGAITAKELLASQTEAAQAKAANDAARRYLDLLQSSASNAAGGSGSQGQTAYLNAQLEFAEIHSPFAGVITEQFMYPGDMAKPDIPIFTLMDLATAVARAQVPADKIASVRRGQSCSFESTDFPNRRSTGRVSVVSQVVDPARRTVEVWCKIPNPQRILRAGVFGSVTVSVGKAEHAVVMPESAVLFKEGSTQGTAVVVDEKHVAHIREVEANLITGGRVQVVQGIQPGETIVTEGGYGLPEGTDVTLMETAK